MSEDVDSARDHEPTQKRLDEARRRGEIVRSAELNTAVAYGGFLLAFSGSAGAAALALGETGTVLLGQADRIAPALLAGASAPVAGLLARTGWALAPVLMLPAGAVLVSLFAQRALVFAPDRIAPRLSRLSPAANARQRFGRSGLFEFAKSVTKLAVSATVLWRFLAARLPEMLASQRVEPAQAMLVLGTTVVDFLAVVAALTLAIGGVDYLWQRAELMRRLRMTRQEVIDEFRQSEGDPHAKGQRRQRGREIATNRMLADVPKADVVIVNPTHYAVALKWQRGSRRAPVCLAKGVDDVAARIRAAAAEAGVPIHADPPTARAIHATVEIGREILPEQYRAVAAAIRFAEAMRRRARERQGR